MSDLRSRLHDLAREVEISEHLAGAARVRSARLRRRRIAGVASATVIALAAGTGATAALVADTRHHHPVTPGTRPASPGPTVTELPGTLWYWSYTADGHGTVIWSRAGTAPPHQVATLPGVEGQVALSPDGTRLAWVERHSGRLLVGAPDGSGARQIAQAAPDAPCGIPSWSGDGAKVMYVGLSNGRRAIFTVQADGTSPLVWDTVAGPAMGGCWPAWVTQGSDRGELLYSGPNRQGMQEGPRLPIGGVDMAAVFCANTYWTVYSSKPVSRRPQLPRPETASMVNGPVVAKRLPVPGVLGISCLPRDVMLIQSGRAGRVERLVLLDSADPMKVLAVAPEPAEAATLGLLGYVAR